MRTLITGLILSLFSSLTIQAATVDTVSIYSNAMHRDYKCVVIKPVMVQDETIPLPVVYLLHGFGGWYANWLISVPELKTYADQWQLMIVCPDGGYSSWYVDSPVDTSMRFETYISQEVPDYIDAHYPTIKNRKGRAITGLSMGGHGGLFLGFRHTNEFGACGSMSGGVDLRPFPKSWQLSMRIGDSTHYPDNWKNYSVVTVLDSYATKLATETSPKVDSLAIIIDCGTEDFFYQVNHTLHEKMVQLKVPHDYIERPGEHNWKYWSNAVKYQLLFFREYFNRVK